MPNLFGTKSPEALAALIQTLMSVVHTTNDYGITADMLANASLARGATETAITDQRAAIAAEKAATQAKKAGKRQAVAALNAMAAVATANPDVTDKMPAAIGFAPRRSAVPRPAVAKPVTGLAATPATDGSVRLSRDRSGNSKAATFTIEASADGAAWAIVAATPRVSLTLSGFAPGATAYFRVTAINATVPSRPSAVVGIYLPATPAEALRLRVA